MQNSKGLVHLYYGDGKGKTTAALGLAIRAAGSGLRVVFVQFLKSQNTGELAILDAIPNITVLRGKEGSSFSFTMSEDEKSKTKIIHTENLKKAMEIAEAGQCDVLVLDEAIGAYSRNLIDKTQLEKFVQSKPEKLEIIMTGRKPAKWMFCCSDYASEIKKVKHPFDKGIPARHGIEK